MPWEPLRPRGLVPAEGIRFGPPPRWPAPRSAAGGAREGRAARRSGCRAGSTPGFLQSRRGPRLPGQRQVRGAGGLPGGATGRLLSGTSEKSSREPRCCGWCRPSPVPLHRVHPPCLSGQANRRGAGDPGRLAVSVDVHASVCDSPLAVWVVTCRFPKRAGNNHPNSSFANTEFGCEEKRDSNAIWLHV